MIHFISSDKGGRFTEVSDCKHCKTYVFSSFSDQKLWLCIMTDHTSRYICITTMTENSMTKTENLLYFTVPPTGM